jgi:hypothetical protein
MDRVDDQINWYDRKSIASQRWYKRLKIAAIVAAALVPFAAGFGALAVLTGGLGVCIVILEGLQGLNQYQQNWINYRSTCEALRHEKYLYLAKAASYLNAEHPDALFAERVESLISREHAKWVSEHEQQGSRKGKSGA